MDKYALREAIIARLRYEFAVQAGAARDSHAEATSEESKAEHQYDMRGQEAAYLAEGQARLAADLGEAIRLYEALTLPRFGQGSIVALGALVTLKTQDRCLYYFVGPRNGGLEVSLGGDWVTVVTPQSPLGQRLMGQTVGATVATPGRGSIPHQITSIA